MTVRYTFGHYINQCVEIDGKRVSLTPMENDLFFMLYVNMGRPVLLADIIDALWGGCEDGGPLWPEHIVAHVCFRLRNKTCLPIFGAHGSTFCVKGKSVVFAESLRAAA